MPDSTLNRLSVALYVAKPNPISYPQKTAECQNLSEADIDVGVEAAKSGVAAEPGQPARTPDRDLPRFRRFG